IHSYCPASSDRLNQSGDPLFRWVPSMSDAYDDFHRLTPVEKLYVALNPVNALIIEMNRENATKETIKRFHNNGRNDASDAFRHFFWSALLARDIGLLDAIVFTTAHESAPDNPPDEKDMDLHNNSVGLKIGSGFWFFPDSNDALSGKCYAALLNGQLKVL